MQEEFVHKNSVQGLCVFVYKLYANHRGIWNRVISTFFAMAYVPSGQRANLVTYFLKQICIQIQCILKKKETMIISHTAVGKRWHTHTHRNQISLWHEMDKSM